MTIDFEDTSSERLNMAPGATSLSTFQNVTGATLCAWINAESIQTTDVFAAFSNGAPAGLFSRMAIEQQVAQFLALGRRLDADAIVAAGGGSPVTNTLFHVASVADFNGQSLILYVDGVNSGSMSPAGWTGATSNTASPDVHIASQDDGSQDYFDGRVMDVRAYARDLSAAEVLHIYESRGRDGIVDGLINRWKLIEGAPSVSASGAGSIVDTGIGKNTGDPVNTPTYAEWLVTSRRARRAA
jgi:hypothetical protein